MPEQRSNGKNGINDGVKAFGAFSGVLLMLVGVYALTQPADERLNQRIEFLEREIERSVISTTDSIGETRGEIRAHEGIVGHPGVLAQQATMQQRFGEVETQFDDLERRIRDLEDWQIWWLRVMPTLDATQAEKIFRLEQTIYKDEEVCRPKSLTLPEWPAASERKGNEKP